MIRITGVRKRYPGAEEDALKGVSLNIETGKFFTLLGPSGCGKSTLLRCIAGLEHPDEGEIELGSQVVYSDAAETNTPVYRRDIGMVFQSYAIWPHMTVRQNVEFPLRYSHRGSRLGKGDIADRAMEALAAVSMDHLANRYAPLLSGGEQQRVALARALVHRPAVLLLDEPLSNLDAKLRAQMRLELVDIQARAGVTTIYVTHDQDEAFALSDEMAVMELGVIRELGAPRDVYHTPSSRFGAEFLGTSTKVSGEVTAAHKSSEYLVVSPVGELVCRSSVPIRVGAVVNVYIRPEDLRPLAPSESTDAPAEGGTHLRGHLRRVVFLGSDIEWFLEIAGIVIKGRVSSAGREAKVLFDCDGGELDVWVAPVNCLEAV